MSENKRTIIDSWPSLKDEMEIFLSDTDAWVINQLSSAYDTKDWNAVGKLLEIMIFVHNLSHSH